MSKTCARCEFTGSADEFHGTLCRRVCNKARAVENHHKRRKIAIDLKEGEFISQPCVECGTQTKFEDRTHKSLCQGCYQKKNREIGAQRHKIFHSWLSGKECAVCGLSDPLTLEWAHKDRTEKIDNVSHLIQSRSLAVARAEAEKCTLKCGNCHYKETNDELASWRSEYMETGTYPTGSYATQKRFILEYLLSHPCVICGETDIRCLEFDHIEPKDKSFGVTRQMSRSVAEMRKEINKCQILCRNHHKYAAPHIRLLMTACRIKTHLDALRARLRGDG